MYWLVSKHVRSCAVECWMSHSLNKMVLGKSAGRGSGWDEGWGLGGCVGPTPAQPLPGIWCSFKLMAACECVKDGAEVACLIKTSNKRFCRGFIALVKWWMNRTNQICLFENRTGKGNNFWTYAQFQWYHFYSSSIFEMFKTSAGKGGDSVSRSLQMELLRCRRVQCLVPCYPAGKRHPGKVLPLSALQA